MGGNPGIVSLSKLRDNEAAIQQAQKKKGLISLGIDSLELVPELVPASLGYAAWRPTG